MTQQSVVGKKNVHGRAHTGGVYASRCYCRAFLEGKRGPESCTFPSFLRPPDVLQPCDPRRPRHAQQTSPTTRSGRHAAFIMFPRSSFDGSTPAELESRVEGQWACHVGALCHEKPRRRVILQLSDEISMSAMSVI